MTGQYISLLRQINHDFTLGELIGTGAFANVYKATSIATKTKVAIKSYKMKKNILSTMFRIASEMAFLNITEHVNIIKFIACAMTKASAYLALEFIPKGTLRNYMPNRIKLTPQQLQSVIKQLMSALIYLHSLSIMHGDIKPENILVEKTDPDMVIKLSDFGLSEIIMGSKRLFKHSGTFSYMAPELHFNLPYDTSSDLFSAGVVIYELIYDQKPIQKDLYPEYLNLLRRRVEITYVYYDGYSPECINLLKSLLNYDKEGRPTLEQLINHSYLQLAPPTHSMENRYEASCRSFIQSSQLLKNHKIGLAYIEAVQGFLQLRLYANTVKDNEGLHLYLEFNLRKYADYIIALQNKFLNENCLVSNVDPHIKEDSFRCMLFSTPLLLNAYDICLVGNMYIANHKRNVGVPKLEEGLSLMFASIPTEPPGERRRLLINKMKQWVALLEKILADELEEKSMIEFVKSKLRLY